MNQDIYNRLAAIPFEDLWGSQRLWPDPMEAPDVPPKLVLENFLDNPNTVDPDLARHIQNSVACLRALKELQAEDQAEVTTTAAMTTFFQKVGISDEREDRQSENETANDLPVPFVRPLPKEISPRQIRSVRHEFQCWDGESLRRGFNFQPVDVLITSERIQRPAGDFFRAIPCSSAEIWRTEDMLCPEDVVFTTDGSSEWVLHTWLGYPVSADDLDDCLGELSEMEMGRIHGEIEALNNADPVETTEPEWLSLERERLAERADTLPSTVDALRLQWEAEAAGESMDTHATSQNIIDCADFFRIPQRWAADDQAVVSNIAIISQAEFDQFCQESGSAATVRESPERPRGEAIVLAGPLQDDNCGFLQWEIHPAQPKGSKVVVVDVEAKTELGEAHLSEDGRIVTLKDVPWDALMSYQKDRAKLSDLTILVIHP